MGHTNTPDYLWYKALQYESTLHNHSSKPILQNKTPIEKEFGTTDILALLQYSFLEPIYYYDDEVTLPHSRELPGRF